MPRQAAQSMNEFVGIMPTPDLLKVLVVFDEPLNEVKLRTILPLKPVKDG